MIEHNFSQFRGIDRSTDEWLTDDDLNLHARRFPPGPAIGLYLLNNEDAYADGYKIAADRVVAGLNTNDQNYRIQMYPIVFLYRHHIELKLKRIINLGYHLDRKGINAPYHHHLKELWEIAHSTLDKYWPKEHCMHLRRVDQYLQSFVELGPNPEAFRYPCDTKGNVSVGNLWSVDLQHLCLTIARVSKFFDFCIKRLEHNLDS